MTTLSDDRGLRADGREVTVVPAVDAPATAHGCLTYGSHWHVAESLARSVGDSRWESRAAVLRAQGDVVGLLPIHRVAARDAELALDCATAPEALANRLVIGGYGAGLGGAAVTGANGVWQADGHVEDLVVGALRIAEDEGLLPVAPAVPAAQVPAFVAAWGSACVVALPERWAELSLPADGRLESFLHGSPRKVRQTWNSDLRNVALHGTVSTQPLTRALAREAAPLVEGVARRHNTPSHPQLVELQLRPWADDGSGVAFTLREPAGTLLGVAVGRMVASHLVLADVGLVDDHPARGRVYSSVTFAQPLVWALEHGLERIVYGRGHHTPKALHGAHLERLFTIGTDIAFSKRRST